MASMVSKTGGFSVSLRSLMVVDGGCSCPHGRFQCHSWMPHAMPRLEQCNARVEDLEAVDAKRRQQGLVWQDMARPTEDPCSCRNRLCGCLPHTLQIETSSNNWNHVLDVLVNRAPSSGPPLKRTAASTSSQILQK